MAGSLNKVMLIGNLGKDPEARALESGTTLVRFPIATSETYKNKQGEKVTNTEWHNIVLWRGLAEVAEKYLKKGDQVYIEGRLKTRSWQDDSGQTKYATEIQADSMTMLGNKRDNDNTMADSGQSYQQPETPSAPSASPEDDLPF